MIKIWNFIKTNITIFLLISLSFVAIYVLEINAKIYINQRIQKYAEMQQEEVYRYFNNENFIEFKIKYKDRLSHLRGPGFARYKDDPPSNLLFSVVRPFSRSNSQNILIQGDSWAQAAQFSQKFLKKVSKKNHAGIIHSGVSSYSPSPMTIQLDILRDDFAIHPSIIIGIIDQTDIGDELFRYTYQQQDKTGRLKSLLPEGTTLSKMTQFLERKNNFNSSKFALVKFFNLGILHIKSRYLNRKVPKSKLGPEILSPLVNGVDIPTTEHFFLRLNRYINTVFADSKMQYLILVTHPYRKHLVDNKVEKRFKGEVGTLVNQIVTESSYKDRIRHIDFLKTEKNKFLSENLETVFKKDDPFSHLTEKMYSDYYYPYIFSKIKDLYN
ncbi:hypothetical protein M1N16_02955 [Nitrospinaceae bacterium]|nr:hypothetical protein [Nitrospinaceae bacterium]